MTINLKKLLDRQYWTIAIEGLVFVVYIWVKPLYFHLVGVCPRAQHYSSVAPSITPSAIKSYHSNSILPYSNEEFKFNSLCYVKNLILNSQKKMLSCSLKLYYDIGSKHYIKINLTVYLKNLTVLNSISLYVDV